MKQLQLFSKHLHLLVCLFVLMSNSLRLAAQADTEFWFAVPEAINSHADRPIFLYVTNMGQSACNVQLSLPANVAFTPLSLTLNPSASANFNLTPYIDLLENNTANSVENKGLYIKSTGLITAYYEIKGEEWGMQYNPELFALKGKNALGRKFFIPMQTQYPNAGYSETPRASFDIIATENNTSITITPTEALLGNHPANVPFTIILQKGQTYSCQALSTNTQKPAGSKVEATKPIAITYKDDSITPGGCADIIGDQLVSIENIGKEYIIIKGQSSYEYAFITATIDNTLLYLNGNPTPVATLQAGDTYTHKVLTDADYLNASQPIYVLQLTAIGCEFGGAILPAIFCTGSGKVSFTRSNPYDFYINLITKKGNEDAFVLNGQTLPSSLFAPVIGTNNLWMAASIQRQDVPLNAASTIENTKGLFHVGLLAGDGGTGMSYGYFSDFSALNIGSDVNLCEGQSIVLNAGFGKDSYLWSNGSTSSSLLVNQAGTYWISVTEGNCQSNDTINVSVTALPYPHIGNDTSICKEIDFTLQAQVAAADSVSYLWQDGSVLSTFHATQTGTYYVQATNFPAGCVGSDTIHISQGALAAALLTKQDLNCHFLQGSFEIELTQGNPQICQYSLDSVTFQPSPIFSQLDTGNYTVFVKDTMGCEGKVQVQLVAYPKPILSLLKEDESCELGNGEILATTLQGHAPFVYSWQLPNLFVTSLPHIGSLAQGTYQVIVNDADNCQDTATITLENINYPPIDLVQNDTTIEIGTQVSLNAQFATNGEYTWTPSAGLSCIACATPVAMPLATTTYYVQTSGKNCIKKDSIKITVENHYYFQLPSAFSPNDDGHNDVYQIIHQNIASADIQIFDRWGRRIFATNDIYATWDGTYQGKSVPEGVYVIRVEYRILGIDHVNVANGTITLIR